MGCKSCSRARTENSAMKHQEILIDYVKLISSMFMYLLLAFFAWVLLRLVNACFWFPTLLQNQTEDQTSGAQTESLDPDKKEDKKEK
nr:PREDICTED: uncharacterized protein LOC109029579 [Bemisia tabaci]